MIYCLYTSVISDSELSDGSNMSIFIFKLIIKFKDQHKLALQDNVEASLKLQYI